MSHVCINEYTHTHTHTHCTSHDAFTHLRICLLISTYMHLRKHSNLSTQTHIHTHTHTPRRTYIYMTQPPPWQPPAILATPYPCQQPVYHSSAAQSALVRIHPSALRGRAAAAPGGPCHKSQLTSQVSSAQGPYRRDYILQKRCVILRRLLIVATPYVYVCHASHVISHTYESVMSHVKQVNASCPAERWGAGVEYHFQDFNEPYAPS